MGKNWRRQRGGTEEWREASDAATLSPIQLVCLHRQMAFSRANYLQSGDHMHPIENFKSVKKKHVTEIWNVGCI